MLLQFDCKYYFAQHRFKLLFLNGLTTINYTHQHRDPFNNKEPSMYKAE